MERLRARQERRKEGKKGGEKGTGKNNGATAAVEKKPEPVQFEMGMYVRIIGQQAVGEIMSVNRNCAIVRFGAIKSTVALNRLQPAEAPKEEMRKVSFLTSETQENLHNKRLNFKSEIDIRGMRGDEAVQAVSYFLDDATVCSVRQLRVLHGTGNGILRTLVRQYLSTVPFVRTFHDEHVQFGGAGITVIDLE